MESDQQSYGELMDESDVLLRSRRDLEAAAKLAERAANLKVASTPMRRAEALQRAGICYRLSREYSKALKLLHEAKDILSDAARQSPEAARVRLANVLRDLAMVYLDRQQPGDYDNVKELLDDSLKLLRESDGTSYYNSRSFMGRHWLLAGDLAKARAEFTFARDNLRRLGETHFELNTLVWLMKCQPRYRRFREVPRGLKLARQDDCGERFVEILILAIGGWKLHRKVEGKGMIRG